MKDQRSLHLKVQEMIDCYATADPLQEMSRLPDDADSDEAAVKWLALAALHGINAGAENISLHRASDGTVQVTAKYRPASLPTPGASIGDKIFSAAREVIGVDQKKGKSALALGVRDSSVELKVKVKSDSGEEQLRLKFPR